MQCSGIHRSLGVHISKVRSATLDTWLPEQVAFIQSMGNARSNSYWEAELPPNYDRVGIENFIRAKYEEKRWIAKDGKPKSPSGYQEDKPSLHHARPEEINGHVYVNKFSGASERRNTQISSVRDNVPAKRIAVPVPPKGPEQASIVPSPQPDVQNSETSSPQAEPAKHATEPSPAPSKVDFATDLFNMLSVDDPSGSSSDAVNSDDNAWAGFQSAELTSTSEKSNSTKAVESNQSSGASATGVEDLFGGLSPLTSEAPQKPQKDVKSDIMGLFEKSNMVSPFAVHQQQIAMLAQQQSLLMAAAAQNNNGASKLPTYQQPGLNGSSIPTQNWPNIGYQVPTTTMPLAGQNDLQKLMQAGNYQMMQNAGNPNFSASSLYSMGLPMPVNGTTTAEANNTPAVSTVSSEPAKQSANDYDFSSLTQGFFTKR